MVLPDHISSAAGHGDVAPIEAWLNEGGDVNERDRHQNTLLLVCTGKPYARRIVTMLLRAGASLDAVSDERTAEMELREAEEVNPALRDSDAFLQTYLTHIRQRIPPHKRHLDPE